MKTYQKPPNYTKIQQQYNSAHTDGSLENKSDAFNTIKALVRLNSTLKPKTILILGCRTGYECEVARYMFDSDPLVIGVDIVPEFVEHSVLRVPTILADMHDIDLPDDRFDLIICRGTLEHCYNPKLAIEEMFRLCNDLGTVYLTVDLEKDRDKFQSHFSFSEDPEEWLQIFKDCGFFIGEHGFEDGMFHKGLWVILRKI